MSLAILAGLVGLVVGSFLAALASRWQALDRSFLVGRSRCASCGAFLSWAETLPLVSWLVQRGRCRHCSAAIGVLPPAAEIAAAALAALAWASLPTASALLLTAVGWWLLLLALIDAEHGRLPDLLTLPLLAAGLLAALAGLGPGPVAPLDGLLAAGLGFALFYATARLYAALRGRAGLGLGDAKLLAALGAWVGLAGLGFVVLLGSLTALLGALATGRRRAADAIAFGPWLALAGWGVLWWQLSAAAAFGDFLQ